METPLDINLARDLRCDLERKYQKHAAAIETAWISFDKDQREKCVRAGAARGVLLKNPSDRSLGNAHKIVPEWNVRDITGPDANYLLDQLKHRATKSLLEQYRSGVNGGPGDYAFIAEMMSSKGLRNPNQFEECYTFFTTEDHYGTSYQLTSRREETLAMYAEQIRSGQLIPLATAEFVLQRQLLMLQTLNYVADDILSESMQTKEQKRNRPKKSEKAVTAALAKLTIQAPAEKIPLPDLVANAHDQQDCLEEFLGLLSTEPAVLASSLDVWFYARPELIADEMGHIMRVHTDKYISSAFMEMVHNAVKEVAIWQYICRLLELLETAANDKVSQAILLQELSNVCLLAYDRSKAFFKLQVQAGIGSNWFKRISGAVDRSGNARVNMKDDPTLLTRTDPQLHYILRLCQAETTAPKAVDWIKKLADLHEAHPQEREKMGQSESDALCDLAVITGLIHGLSSAVAMPPLSRKKGQVFVPRFRDLNIELTQFKYLIDLQDFVAPMDNLLRPGMAEGALNKLDLTIEEQAGAKMGFLYQDLVEECVFGLQTQCRRAKAKPLDDEAEWMQSTEPKPPAIRVEERRRKQKTRPQHSSAFDIAPPPTPPAKTDPIAPAKVFKVSSSTAEVFTALFKKSQSRGSVSWTAFEAAMAELGFSVIPKFGSVFTFQPSDSVGVKRSFTVHRPHKSHIEGYRSLIMARRLQRTYGWDEHTFEVS